MADAHRIKLIVEDGYLSVQLLCPESGCVRGETCGTCGRDYTDDETEPCGDCRGVEASDCWLASWFENEDAREFLRGRVEFVVPAIEAYWDFDYPIVRIGAPPCEDCGGSGVHTFDPPVGDFMGNQMERCPTCGGSGKGEDS
jgi:hypothetical protein